MKWNFVVFEDWIAPYSFLLKKFNCIIKTFVAYASLCPM